MAPLPLPCARRCALWRKGATPHLESIKRAPDVPGPGAGLRKEGWGARARPPFPTPRSGVCRRRGGAWACAEPASPAAGFHQPVWRAQSPPPAQEETQPKGGGVGGGGKEDNPNSPPLLRGGPRLREERVLQPRVLQGEVIVPFHGREN